MAHSLELLDPSEDTGLCFTEASPLAAPPSHVASPLCANADGAVPGSALRAFAVPGGAWPCLAVPGGAVPCLAVLGRAWRGSGQAGPFNKFTPKRTWASILRAAALRRDRFNGVRGFGAGPGPHLK